ncbi:Aste57867_14399 [Aphanomyces stellatus]|uniref:Aste57867_14399 protein n=1 Tax=Aphanomyces stellatus TaxID=120398 RepID=A0A485L289_9STRA|nr:hypothetical protein As57867_014345 [Aphanomyces stellatus]VFT91221.1 Aste57867_14399 [Aphanomyces stellatus]
MERFHETAFRFVVRQVSGHPTPLVPIPTLHIRESDLGMPSPPSSKPRRRPSVGQQLLAVAATTRFEKTKSWRAPENRLGRRTFAALWLATAFLHAVYVAHLVLLAYAHVAVPASARVAMGLPDDMTPAAVACVVVAALHLGGLVDMLRNRAPRRRVVRVSLQANAPLLVERPVHHRVYALYQHYFADDAMFGAQGHLFPLRMELQQAASIVSQTIQAVAVAHVSTHAAVTAAYGACIALSCVMAPLVFASSRLRPVVQRTLALLAPVALAATLECVLSWLQAVPYYAAKDDDDDHWSSRRRPWTAATAVLVAQDARLARRLFLTSVLTLVARLLPSMLVWWSLRYVEWILARAYDVRYCVVASLPRKTSLTPEQMRHKDPLHRLVLTCRVLAAAWGLAVLVLTAPAAPFRASCAATCRAKLAPVDAWTCHCLVQTVDCRRAGRNESWPPSLLVLTVVACDETSASLPPQLVGFHLAQASLEAWWPRLPPSLAFLSLVNVSRVPSALAVHVPSLVRFAMVNSSPSDRVIMDVAPWADSLELLAVDDCNMTSLPRHLARLTQLTTLSLRGNNLTTSIDEIANLPNLAVLDLSRNPSMAALPQGLDELSGLHTLHADMTNVSIVDASLLHAVADVSLMDTPYCEQRETQDPQANECEENR